jgi:hypothetical protein
MENKVKEEGLGIVVLHLIYSKRRAVSTTHRTISGHEKVTELHSCVCVPQQNFDKFTGCQRRIMTPSVQIMRGLISAQRAILGNRLCAWPHLGTESYPWKGKKAHGRGVSSVLILQHRAEEKS